MNLCMCNTKEKDVDTSKNRALYSLYFVGNLLFLHVLIQKMYETEIKRKRKTPRERQTDRYTWWPYKSIN